MIRSSVEPVELVGLPRHADATDWEAPTFDCRLLVCAITPRCSCRLVICYPQSIEGLKLSVTWQPLDVSQVQLALAGVECCL